MDTLQRSLSESCFTDEDEEIGLVPRDSQIPSSTASRFYERESTETSTDSYQLYLRHYNPLLITNHY